jgi:heat shock protein HtpX
MFHEIARNKTKSVVVVVMFFAVWILAGVGIGKLATLRSGTAGGMVAGGVIAGLLALLAILWALTMGQFTVLRASGAREVSQAEQPQLYDIVQTLAIGAGLPMPRVYVIDDPSPNAFATGMSPRSAAVTATTGLLQIMNREELEGVIGHEMSHIRNYDVRLVLIVSTVVAMAAILSSMLWRSLFFTRSDRNSGGAIIVLIAAAAVLSVIAVIVGPIMQFALSRSRESLADASGVELTRNPAGLLHALQKLQQNDQPFRKMTHATAAMCIDNPLEHHTGWVHRLYDTHPPIEERIAALERMLQVRET